MGGEKEIILQLPESYKVTIPLTYSPAFLLISLNLPSLCYENLVGCVTLACTTEIVLGLHGRFRTHTHTHSNVPSLPIWSTYPVTYHDNTNTGRE